MRVLDLFCGGGGAAAGYAQAWPHADIVGVDARPQPYYPFQFIQGNVFDLDPAWMSTFDFIHASPPCQAHTTMSNRWRNRGTVADEHVSLVADTRNLLRSLGKPYVIENVTGARSTMIDPLVLSGDRFGLQVIRPRLFETSFPIDATTRPPRQPVQDPIGVYGPEAAGQVLWTRIDGTVQRRATSVEEAQQAMGNIHYMPWRTLCESIPAAYTQWIATQFTACQQTA